MSKSSGLTLPDFSIHLGSSSPLRTYKSFLIFFFFLFFFFDLGSKLTFDFFFFFSLILDRNWWICKRHLGSYRESILQ
ncbi:hypothetical protein AtEden1_Chr2g0237311 [Arabidopsis thaliana]